MLVDIFDSHAHYNDKSFREDMDSILSSLPEKGVRAVINCGTDLNTSLVSSVLSEQYDFVYFAAGIHPEDCGDKPLSDIEAIQKLLNHKKCVAVGEIGLDFHWPEPSRETQMIFFEKQLILANENSKPVIIHDREAHEPTLELIKKYRPSGVLHCYSGSVETMREAVKLGMYIGLGGAVTFKNAKKGVEVAKEVPLERLLLETDCPYMAPVPFRGHRNDSSLISYTAQFIAQLRGIGAQELIDHCTKNTEKLFFGV
ncbi:MAG: TatD family hydrolase [Clostridia bacterium]|nr:TatD family hydrolase [Clostridia bacterium]